MRHRIDPLAPPDAPVASPQRIADAEALVRAQLATLQFAYLSQSGDQILARATVPEPPDPKKDTAKEQGEGAEPMPPDRVLTHEEIEAEDALVRVQGAQFFYHLINLNGGGGGGGGDDQQKQDDSSKDDQSQSDEQKDSEESGKEGDEEQEEEEGEEEQKDQQNQQDEPDDSAQEEREQPQESQPSEEKPDARQQRVEDMLRALEDQDDNFQLRKALEHTPNQYIEKDW